VECIIALNWVGGIATQEICAIASMQQGLGGSGRAIGEYWCSGNSVGGGDCKGLGIA